MKIYGDTGSGNCLKVKYVADHLRLPYTWVPVDIMKAETKTPEFLSRFPMGRIPAVELADGRLLAESNAIIRYLARGSALRKPKSTSGCSGSSTATSPTSPPRAITSSI
jgi:glutathione S-transferase